VHRVGFSRKRGPMCQRPVALGLRNGVPATRASRGARGGTTAGEAERSDLVMPSIVNLSWLPPIFAQASERLNLGELGGATVWLAVTGLSRSGKTVFITSLIHNLLSSAHNPNRMPLLGVVGERRLIAATVEGAGANRLPR